MKINKESTQDNSTQYEKSNAISKNDNYKFIIFKKKLRNMIKMTLSLIIVGLLFSFGDRNNNSNYSHNFGLGEEINYKVHFGFINAATAKMIINDDMVKINDKKCYKIDIYGKTIGMFDLFLKIRDNWGSYISKEEILPIKSYRNIEEGRYRKKETVYFDHKNQKAKVRVFDNQKKKWNNSIEYKISKNTREMVSGYYYLRTLDFKNFKKNELINFKGFFEDESYDFNVRYLGKTIIKTSLGKINALVISPIMPENGLFDGENSIKIWISDDKNKVPLKVKAKMFVGALEVDIESYKRGTFH